jgi:hypothetical protein
MYVCATGDAHHVAAKIKGEVPHRSTDVEHQGRKAGQEVGAKVDHAVSILLSFFFFFLIRDIQADRVETKQVETINRDVSKAKSETEAYAKAAKADALKKIDELDRKVEDGAAKSKSYLSSWFGSK